jgi:ArsR family transcriptional regulator, lead/cadmium/zinc/bismuth-responsive transcriptional repressor
MFCDDLTMHLVPADRRSRRIIDGERVCQALAGLGECGDIPGWAELFRTLGDPSRLTLLICIHQAGPISVTDLAVAADMNETTVSQALRLLRATGTVTAHRSGRIVRYELTSDEISNLIEQIAGPRRGSGHMHAAT